MSKPAPPLRHRYRSAMAASTSVLAAMLAPIVTDG
jgi:hypothetical protein